MLAQEYLRLVCQNLPVVGSIVSAFGELPLSSYLRELSAQSTLSYQPRDDLIRAVRQYIVPLLGEEVASLAAVELARNPVVVTTNHHGVDYFSQSVQGSILVALERIGKGLQPGLVFVFSCGNIPLNASSYPRGLLLYRVPSGKGIGNIPTRVSIFPDRLKRCVVASAPPITEPMIAKAKAVLRKMALQGELSEPLVDTALEILDHDYGATVAAELATYSDQSVIINHRIFRRLFKHLSPAPQLIYLELEQIAGALLQSDLSHPGALIRHILFNPEIRRAITAQLDEERGCWHCSRLENILREDSGAYLKRQAKAGSGTMFFWGIDDFRRRVPLYLAEGKMLVGRNDRGALWQLPFTPEAITEGLRQQRLLPSLFTCFVTVSFARGLVCIGGYFQGRYLARMQEAVVTALKEDSVNREICELVANVRTCSYLDSMLAYMVKVEDRFLVPAGPMEILSAGGIGEQEMGQMLALSVREAHLAGLFETVPDAILPENRTAGWKKQIAKDLFQLLAERVVAR